MHHWMLDQAGDTVPEEGYWGCWGVDGPETGAEGTANFMWAETRNELCDLFGKYYLSLYFEMDEDDKYDDEDAQKLFKKLHTLWHKVKKDEIPVQDACSRTNKWLEGYSTLEWVGPFEELVSGDGEFQNSIRARFRDIEDLDEPSPPIESDELNEFAQFCQEHAF